ncbi:MAG TPA: calcineurin-like phosphoesterase C-terminal domain-containing protein [Lysobacter sp.]|nr:calcineurin-like phosphoesterase C-terminal domain-containing protein [Lysobacter sp.]
MIRTLVAFCLALAAGVVNAQGAMCSGVVYEDRDRDGSRDAGERGLGGIRVSDGVSIATTDRDGRYRLPADGDRACFVIKPATFDVLPAPNRLPAFWRAAAEGGCPDFGLVRASKAAPEIDVLVFADTQTKSMTDVDYYARDIVEPLRRAGAGRAQLGLTLGDIVDDDVSLYPAVTEVTTRLGVPWLHVPGNHDVDAGVTSDDDALASFHRHFGPDTFAWEEPQADFLMLDDVISRPGQRPAYVGGLREDQFAFIRSYLATRDPKRLLVVAVHIPFFPVGGETFRAADRERLFAMLAETPRVLLLSAHGHVQRHVFHDAATGWHGATPLHEYNVGAACGAFWSGAPNADGIPDSTMSDGTPNGTARLQVRADGRYRLAWQPAGIDATSGPLTRAMRLHAPRALRRGAYPAWGVFANVWMGTPDMRVEFRVDGGEWKPMKRVEQPDPWLLAENVRDDDAETLRGYDRSPEADASTHLWRGALPTTLAAGRHWVEVRAFDPWQGVQTADTSYRLIDAAP